MSDFEKDKREILESAEKVLNKAHAIDCSLAVNYEPEKNRMCENYKWCDGCPIQSAKRESNSDTTCPEWRLGNLQKAVEIVQAWSDEHPREKVVTMQDKFLEHYPNSPLSYQDEILTVNPCSMEKQICCPGNCFECRKKYWSQSYKENTNGQD